MISYFFQAGLTSLFGPLLPVFIWLLKFRFDEDAIEKVSTVLRKLQASVYGVNAFFCVSLLIAGVVRYRQVPSIMEVGPTLQTDEGTFVSNIPTAVDFGTLYYTFFTVSEIFCSWKDLKT